VHLELRRITIFVVVGTDSTAVRESTGKISLCEEYIMRSFVVYSAQL
jgi:hypothetical protein